MFCPSPFLSGVLLTVWILASLQWLFRSCADQHSILRTQGIVEVSCRKTINEISIYNLENTRCRNKERKNNDRYKI